MPVSIQSPPAYKRLHHHPLASAILAILWATLLVVGVQGYTAWGQRSVLADEGVTAPEQGLGQQLDESAPLDAH